MNEFPIVVMAKGSKFLSNRIKGKLNGVVVYKFDIAIRKGRGVEESVYQLLLCSVLFVFVAERNTTKTGKLVFGLL